MSVMKIEGLPVIEVDSEEITVALKPDDLQDGDWTTRSSTRLR